MSKDETEAVRAGASSKEIRQARVRRLLRRIGLWVVAPTLIGIVYYGFLASPQYDSVALVRVQSKGTGKSKATQVNSMLIKDFGESRAMLDYLVKEHDFDKHYQSGGDFVSRLSSDGSTEDRYDYFREKVSIKYVERSGDLQITVRAFSGEAAQGFSKAILAAAETMTNATDEPARAARISLASEEVTKAAEQLASAQKELSALEVKAAERGTVLPPIEGAALPPAEGAALMSVDDAARLETARYQRDVARGFLEQALAAQVKLRADLMKEQLFLAVISPPSAPSGATYPRRVWGMLTVFVLSFVLMGVFSMLAAAIREHARY